MEEHVTQVGVRVVDAAIFCQVVMNKTRCWTLKNKQGRCISVEAERSSMVE